MPGAQYSMNMGLYPQDGPSLTKKDPIHKQHKLDNNFLTEVQYTVMKMQMRKLTKDELNEG